MIADRFSRTRLMLGQEALNRLQQASVMIVGCGAVGGFALEALARAGIGRIVVVDFDTVAVSNINRQILASSQTVGQKKVLVAAERIHAIAPDIQIETVDMRVGSETVSALLNQKVDFVIDAIDSLNPKAALIEMLVTHQIPFISAMGAALKTDLSRIHIGLMDKTKECPLAFFVRKRLRRRGVSLKFPVVCSDEVVADKSRLHWPEEETTDGSRQRHEMGSLVTVTGIFGLMCAHYAIMYLKDKKDG